MSFRRICVYCGSSNRVADRWFEVAREVGRSLAAMNVGVVYGGGRIGLMGALADAALEAGGEVQGVIPQKLLDLELGHRGVTKLHVVPTMHARKQKMAELSDGFIALPGGWGTLEEIFEVTTWTQLRYHDKPVGLLDAHGYYAHLVAFLDHAADESFIRSEHRAILPHADSLDDLLEAMRDFEPPELSPAVIAGPEPTDP